MLPTVADPQENIEFLKGLIGWFNQNSTDLIEEYRRLEGRVDYLKAQLEVKNEELQISLQAREEARAYLLSVLESLKGGVMVLDEELRPTFINQRLIELTGEIDDRRVLPIARRKTSGEPAAWRTRIFTVRMRKGFATAGWCHGAGPFRRF